VACFLILRARTFPGPARPDAALLRRQPVSFCQRPPALDAAPLIRAGASYTDPLPQALVLTAIVIGFGMTAYLAMLALRGLSEAGTDHVDAGREP
jgi:multicomponent K+:H+ antiporter subunit C